MKKFQFSLNTVLGYKQQVMEGLQNEHAILTQRVRKQEEHLQELRRSYLAYNREFREAEAEGITIAEAMKFENGLHFWEKEIEQGTRLLEKYQAETEEKRKQVVAARQDTASIEKLRDKKHESYLNDVRKSEELFIEELVAAKRATASQVS